MDIEHSVIEKLSNFHIESNYLMSKDDFLEGIQELHLGEWRPAYTLTLFGIAVDDGTQWRLEIQYSDGRKPYKVYGNNAYPYNLNALQELVGIEPYEMNADNKS